MELFWGSGPPKADCLDAIASRVPPLVALLAGQVQVVRGGPFKGKAACSSVSSASGSHAPSVSGAQGFRVLPQGQKPYSQPRPSFPVLGVGGGAKGKRRREGWSGSCPALLDSACTWLQSWGQREDQTECVPCFPPLSPKDVPSLSAPLLESLPPLGCCTSHVQIHLVVGTVGVDGAQSVFPNLVSISLGSTKEEH